MSARSAEELLAELERLADVGVPGAQRAFVQWSARLLRETPDRVGMRRLASKVGRLRGVEERMETGRCG